MSLPITRTRDGRRWRIGAAAEVDWIANNKRIDRTITAAIPPLYAAYATVVLPNPEDGLDPHERVAEWTGEYIREWRLGALRRHESALLDVLVEHSANRFWWLGYLEYGLTSDIIFPDASRVSMYSDWHYVLVEAGPDQAATWREPLGWKIAIPDVMFPADRSWLVSTLWDDDWTCIGGTEKLVNGLLSHPLLGARTRRVNLDEDATPRGHRPY